MNPDKRKNNNPDGFSFDISSLMRESDGKKDINTLFCGTEEEYRLAFEHAIDAIFWADAKTGIIINCNKAAETLLEKERKDIIGQNQTALHPPGKKLQYRKMFKKHVADKGVLDDEAEVITGSGKIKPVHITAASAMIGDKPIMQGIFRDITERKKIQKLLDENYRRYRSIFENSPVALWESDLSEVKSYIEGLRSKGVRDFKKYFKEHPEDLAHCATMVRILDVNRITLELYKAKNKKMFWGGLSQIFTKDSYRAYMNEIMSLVENKMSFEYACTVKTLPGNNIHIIVKGMVVPGHEKDYSRVIVSNVNITEITEIKKSSELLNRALKKSNKKLEQLALIDPLTGLYNHRFLSEVVDREYNRAKRYSYPIAAIMLDIDYFKSINDVYGHKFGDLVLKQFARQLKNLVRKNDIIARFGGEEFIVLSPRTDCNGAANLANRILEALNVYSFGDNIHSVKLKLSMGVCSYPEDSITKPLNLVENAEAILNKAKNDGGNRIYKHSDLRAERAVPSQTVDINYLRKKIDKLDKRTKESLTEAVFAFSKTLDMKDHDTGDHVERTVHYAVKIAEEFGLSEADIERIRKGAILHDLGKIGISEKILLKKSKLTKKEMDEIKKHPQIGVDIIRPIHALHDVIPLILGHHEHWDGKKGYPHGLKGKEIPIGARIIAVADGYQALTSERPYRKAFSKDEAIEIIKESSGTVYDPEIVKIFLKIV